MTTSAHAHGEHVHAIRDVASRGDKVVEPGCEGACKQQYNAGSDTNGKELGKGRASETVAILLGLSHLQQARSRQQTEGAGAMAQVRERAAGKRSAGIVYGPAVIDEVSLEIEQQVFRPGMEIEIESRVEYPDPNLCGTFTDFLARFSKLR